DTVVGTLGIFNTTQRKRLFPSGLSRMASRDLTDLIQTQIVDDIRALYDPAWTRRALWDRPYSEAFRPNVPAMLLELSSHQNLLDIRFGQEPMFRFHTSRAIYKGMLKFLGSMYGIETVVQPLPVTHFSTEILDEGAIRLSWKPRADPLEPTADPDRYRVYTRINSGGFDNGMTVEGTTLTIGEIQQDAVYSFKVTALNGGGESFRSEVLSVCSRKDQKGMVLIINGFDRTGGPAWFEDTAHAGFLPMVDQGVPYHEDLHTVGAQFDYLKASPWLDDDSPGHGASYADLEGKVIPGNSFDFAFTHGASIRKAGYSFVSVSDESVLEGGVRLENYRAVDFIAGEEKTSYLPKNDTVPLYQVFTEPMLILLGDYLETGGGLFLSGAHIASDMHALMQDSLVASLLKYKWRTSNASRLGEFYFTDPAFGGYERTFEFNTGLHPTVYTVEGADALEPADSTSTTLVRYRENNMSAAVAYRGNCGIVA
ncbi:MAG: fibronectin type III domain-containing protein, partial [Bacteroidales bacterium]|nr:fibronectin type III domain-containing protein [Bacteroidales bacterium]